MKLKTIYSILLAHLPLLFYAQTVIVPGFVTLQNSDFHSAFPLEISVSGAAKISRTNPANGYFEIQCKAATGEFFLTIKKDGYEVVNPRALHVFFHKGKPSVDTVFVCLNTNGAWLELADQYLRVAYNTANQAEEAALAALKTKQNVRPVADSIYRRQQAEIEKRAARAFAHSADIAEFTAPTNTDRCSPAYRAALRAWREGDVPKAIAALTKPATATDWALRARLNSLTLHETEAEGDYEAATLATPLDFQLLRERGRYLFSSDKSTDKAYDFWNKNLPAAHHPNEKATAMHAIAGAMGRKNNFKESISLLQQAIQIRDSLAAANPFFAADFAFSCRVLAENYLRLGNSADAVKWAKKSAAAWQQSPDPCGFSFCREPMIIDNLLASIPGTPPVEALKWQTESLKKTEQLAEHYTIRGNLEKASCLMNRAKLFKASGDFARALNDLHDYAAIMEEYENDWPLAVENWRSEYWQLAAAVAEPNKAGGDESLIAEGMEHFNKFAERSPMLALSMVNSLNNQASSLAAANKLDDALTKFDESLQLAEPLLTVFPEEITWAKSFALGNKAQIWANKNDVAKARILVDEAIQTSKKCPGCQPLEKSMALSVAYRLSGQMFFRLKDFENGEQAYSLAVAEYKNLNTLQPSLSNAFNIACALHQLCLIKINLAFKSNDATKIQEVKNLLDEEDALLKPMPDHPDVLFQKKSMEQLKTQLKN